MTPLAATDLYLGEFGVFDGTSETTLRVSGGKDGTPLGYTTAGGDTPATTNYPGRMSHALMLARTAFRDKATSGRSEPATGEIDLQNEDFGLDYLKRYAFDGRTAVVRRGASGASYPASWTTVLDATMHAASWDLNGLRINVREARKYASIPLQTSRYGGTGGLDGTADMAGTLLPVTIGAPPNATPTLVDPVKLIYQGHDGTLSSIAAVRDEGVPLTGGLSWVHRTFSAVAGDQVYGVANIGNTVIIAGFATTGSNFIGRSTDGGVTWTRSQPAALVGQGLQGVRANGSLFVAFGVNGLIATSPDGVTWTIRTSNTTSQLKDAVYSTDLTAWFAVGIGGKVIMSPDAVTPWTVLTSGTTENLSGVTAGKGVVVAVGDNTTIIACVSSAVPVFATRNAGTATSHFHSVVYDDARGLFLATGQDYASGAGAVIGIDAVSSDSVTWKRVDGFAGTRAASGVAQGISGGPTAAISLNSSTGATIVASSVDPTGTTWTRVSGQLTGATLTGMNRHAITTVGSTFIVCGSSSAGAEIWQAVSGTTYANTTDLQDDTKAPQAGSYIACPTAGGSYFRLGSRPVGTLTFDPVEGATAADRTAGQCWARTLQRAGLIAGDYSTAAVTALDTANNAVCGYYADSDAEGVLCGDVAEEFAATVGAGWWGDGSGVIQTKRLEAPATSLVTNPSSLATAPWAVAGGTPVATNAVATYAGKSFSRVTAANTGPIRQPVTVPQNGIYYVTFYVKSNGVTGTIGLGNLYDDTAGVDRGAITATVASDGSITAVAGAGTLVRTALLPGPDNVYGITLKATGCLAANNNYIYANRGTGTATSILLSGFELVAGDPIATFDQDTVRGGLRPASSADDNEGIAPYETVVRWGKNWTVLSGNDLAGDVSDDDREFLSQEWRKATATDSAVLVAHPFSQPRVIDTLFVDGADAQDEADRRQLLHGVDRDWYECEFEMTTALAALELGDVVEVVSNRFGLGAGTRMRILGIKPEAQESGLTTITFTLWR